MDSFIGTKPTRTCIPLWGALGLVLCLSMSGCAGTTGAQRADKRQREQDLYGGGCEIVARFADPIVERRNEGYGALDVIREVRELIAQHMVNQSQARFLDRYITTLTERVYHSQPPWTKEETRLQVLSDCDADFLRALYG
jgi:hypothetical protein